MFSACALLLGACNLPGGSEAAASTPTISVEAIVATQLAAMPTNTITPLPALPLPSVTSTATPFTFLATPTLTLFYDPTITATQSLADCPIIITRTDTKAGDMLHVLRCEDKLEYDLGPFAKGIYAVGPNLKFIVYATDNGYVYTAALGSKDLILVANLVREKKFAAINRGVRPYFVISFWGEAPHYRLVLTDKRFGQKFMYDLPVQVME